MIDKFRTMGYFYAKKYYDTVLFQDDLSDGTSKVWMSVNPQLPGCMSQGDTIDEAEYNLFDARQLYIESCLENGVEVMLGDVSDFSNFPVIKMTVDLHTTDGQILRGSLFSAHLKTIIDSCEKNPDSIIDGSVSIEWESQGIKAFVPIFARNLPIPVYNVIRPAISIGNRSYVIISDVAAKYDAIEYGVMQLKLHSGIHD